MELAQQTSKLKHPSLHYKHINKMRIKKSISIIVVGVYLQKDNGYCKEM